MQQRSPVRATTQFGNPTRTLMLVLALVVALITPIGVAAQPIRGTSFTTSINDHTVAWNENWDASLEGDDEFSTMVMLEGQIMLYSVMFIHDPLSGLDLEQAYHSLSGVLIGSFDSVPTQSVEWEAEDGSYRGAHIIDLSDIDFVLYMRIDPPIGGSGPIMQFAGAPLRAFSNSLDAMQAELTIDGGPALIDDTADDIMAMLNGDDSQGDVTSNAPPTDSEPVLSRGTTERERIPHGIPENVVEMESHEYVSEDNGYTVTYSDAWQDMAEINATVGEFSLAGTGSNRTVVSFSGRLTTETNRAAFFEEVVHRESRYQGYVGSVITDDRLLIASWTADNELAVLEYVFASDTTVVTTMVTITSATPERYINDVRGIELDGEGILRDWDQLWGE